MQRIAVIVPAYNEEKSIAAVVATVKAQKLPDGYMADVVVVNDCSHDTTAQIASGLDCVLLNLAVNLGIGGAVQTGLIYALNNGYNYAVQMDGDGQHPASELPKLINALETENADIVIGSRFMLKEGFQSSFMRRVGINYFTKLIGALTGLSITDATSGYRLFGHKALELASNYYPDEYPEPEAIIYFKLNGLKIIETPVQMNERREGKSSIGTFASLYYMLKVTLAVLFTYIKCRNNSIINN
ncbi:MAG: Undecaprenyl-phosphate mannosyltransferase [Bacteroidetes bacterium ADurb.Bin408]|nr:MAG: Undecaprenyl-phosphate mannosyltransferase [Bacteroidetes bacterium ADurb.Bin408]